MTLTLKKLAVLTGSACAVPIWAIASQFKTFALVALLNGNAYVLDQHLTAEDCMAAIQSGVSRIQISDRDTVPAAGAVLSCEAEQPE